MLYLMEPSPLKHIFNATEITVGVRLGLGCVALPALNVATLTF